MSTNDARRFGRCALERESTTVTPGVSQRRQGRLRSGSKQAFLVAVETDTDLGHPKCAVIEPVRAFDNASISD